MKHFAVFLCLLIPAMAVNARAIQEDTKLTEEKARTSYAFGMIVGGELLETGLEIDYQAFSEGLKATMEQGETLLETEEAFEIVQNAFENAMARQTAEAKIKEEVFLELNAARSEIQVTESGLQYIVLEEGEGPKPSATDTVIVHYEGALIDGTVFDSSYSQEQPEEIPLYMVISGWAEGIQLMSVGSKYQIFIPSNLAYGERGAGQIIPPYSTLVFTIDLIGIVDTSEETEEEE